LPLDYDAWWNGLRAGRSFVTNGPLLVCRANGQLPGHLFRLPEAGALQVDLDVALTTLDRVEHLEIIENGEASKTIALEDQLHQKRTVSLSLTRPGWFLVRAIANNTQTFRFASTAPYYVAAVDSVPAISRRSASFFVEWVAERIALLEQAELPAAERAGVLAAHEEARRFWQKILARATAD
jgi:hypothetical protein